MNKVSKQEIEELISYALKEGYIDDVEDWSDEKKEDFYNKCMAFEPDEDEEQ